MYITKYGTQWGDVPETPGKIWWVAPASPYTVDGRAYSSSDNNPGDSPERALATIQQAVTNATANAGEMIMLLPGTHTSAAVVAINKAGLSFVGLTPAFRQNENYRSYAASSQCNWTSTLAGAAVALTAADCSFTGINFIPVTARTFMTAATCPRTSFVDCAVTLSAAASTATKGIVFSGGSSAYCSFTNCVFLNTIATSAQGPCVDLTGAANFVMEACTIILTGTSSAWAVAVQFGAGSSGIVRNSYIGSQDLGTITVGFDGTGVAVAGAVQFADNRAGVLPGAAFAKNWTATDATLVNNYLATVGGGTGSTLVTTTT